MTALTPTGIRDTTASVDFTDCNPDDSSETEVTVSDAIATVSYHRGWTASMQASHVIQVVPTTAPCFALGFALVLSLVSPCRAEIDDGSADEAALRADAEKTFKEKVGPFVNKYCISCHGPRPEAGINLRSALKSPGAASSFLHWKKAVANVKVHDMLPEYADEIPADDERRQFIEWIGKLKYLAPRDPGPFVIRRLSK